MLSEPVLTAAHLKMLISFHPFISLSEMARKSSDAEGGGGGGASMRVRLAPCAYEFCQISGHCNMLTLQQVGNIIALGGLGMLVMA